MINNKYFSAARDREVIEAGGFFCEACLTGKTIIEQSDDSRYCHGCFKVLLDESTLLLLTRGKPGWVPVVRQYAPLPALEEGVAKLPTKGIEPVGVMQHPGGRPRKEGEVHRSTEWRRQKQGVLC